MGPEDQYLAVYQQLCGQVFLVLQWGHLRGEGSWFTGPWWLGEKWSQTGEAISDAASPLKEGREPVCPCCYLYALQVTDMTTRLVAEQPHV